MKRFVILLIIAASVAGLWLLFRPHRRAFHIDHINDSGAFRGIVDGSYYRKGELLIIDVDQWTVRFGVGDQPGRLLDALYFELGVQSPDGYWSRQIKSDRLEMKQYVRSGQDVVLDDLQFTIPVEESIWTQKTWIVATYETTSSGQVGWNYGLDQFYLFSTQRVSLLSRNP